MKPEEKQTGVFVLLPTGRDAEIVCHLLAAKDIPCSVCESFGALLEQIRSECGPVLVGAEAFGADGFDRLTALLDAQPEWSDLPIIVLLGKKRDKGLIAAFSRHPSAVLLPRPIGPEPLIALVRSAMENRLRQLAVRDMLKAQRALRASEESLKRAKDDLERMVAERTRLAEERAGKLRRLALELIEAEGRERERLAHLLHDDLQQHLAAVKLKLETASPTGRQRREADGILAACVDLLKEAIRKTRRLSYDLSPPALRRGGLAPCLALLVEEMRTNYGLAVSLNRFTETEPGPQTMAVFLYQALKELLFNVVKHAGTDAARIDLQEQEGCFIVRVADSGRGADLGQVYSREGTEPGFGLFSIEERIQSLGGRMTVETIPGNGWVTTLFLPMAPAAETAPAGREEAKASGPLPGSSAPGAVEEENGVIRIMVVDDHHVMRAGLANLLSGEKGFRVVAQAESGRKAVALSSEFRPEVILMDVSMADMDGVEATASITNADPNIRVVGLSMHDDPATRDSMKRAGAAAFLCKSDAPGKIVAVIREAAGRRRVPSMSTPLMET